MAKEMNRHFSKEDLYADNKHMKKSSTSLSLEKCQFKPQWDTISHRSEWQLLKSQEIGWWFMPVIPAVWEAEVGRSPEVRHLRPPSQIWWNPVSTKSTKISWAWWQVPVIPTTQEAEAGELLEPRRQRLQWANFVPLHSSLVDRIRPCLKKKSSPFQNGLELCCHGTQFYVSY